MGMFVVVVVVQAAAEFVRAGSSHRPGAYYCRTSQAAGQIDELAASIGPSMLVMPMIMSLVLINTCK